MARNKVKKASKGSAGSNRKNTEDFLDKYESKPDVISTGSGLMYRIIEDTQGAKPKFTDTIIANQRILLADGSVIADTYKAGLPDEFSIAEAIPGLQEGLQFMPIGARYEFVIPPDLAWGKKGNGSKIGPNAVMQVDLRLIKIA
ncbi:FKBP-type peptidyl-prolyl cis-trans isomerase [Algibacillus agarilyticus]|uniref:FKBP-type peptidyl-prolyl cis-trans isomerase n=1 Tax=Algibacillus agarilyticus TaxID=2234133 RepID=UPI000DCF7D47|nr:FKBP-type peptidyl-prolyl cis-trans isomerase [Algibacillus agarilyticus]